MEWLKITGYDNYIISNKTMEVKNILTGKILKASSGSVRLSLNGVQKNFTPRRLLYCAINGCDIGKIPSDIVVAKCESGCFKAYTRKEYSRIVIAQSNKTRKRAHGDYLEIKKFIDIVLRYKDTGCVDELAHELYGYRSKAIGCCLKNRYVSNEMEAVELTDIAIEKALDRIISGDIVVYPFKYIIGIVKSLKKEINKTRRMEKSFEDIGYYEKRRII